MFINFFGKVKNPCEDCVDGECTMNCSGREPADSFDDKGSLFITYEKDFTVTVKVRTPNRYIDSMINLPLEVWHQLIGSLALPSECHCGKDGHALNSVNCPVHGYETISKADLGANREKLLRLLKAWEKHPDNMLPSAGSHTTGTVARWIREGLVSAPDGVALPSHARSTTENMGE
jgi:hypothetical protein